MTWLSCACCSAASRCSRASLPIANWLCSRSGFTPEVEAARGPDLLLYALDDLLA